MAKMLKQLVFGQKKNPPAPPRPDYEGDQSTVPPYDPPADHLFLDHDYENISKFNCKGGGGGRVQWVEKKEAELVVFDNYSEPADLRAEISTLEADPLYISPVDDRGTAPPPPPEGEDDEEEEDMYCVPYDDATAPPLPNPCLAQGRSSSSPSPPPDRQEEQDATYDVVPDEDGRKEDGEGGPPVTEYEYDEPWEWSVGARLTSSLQVSPAPSSLDGDPNHSAEEEDDDAMTSASRQHQRRLLLYETAFDSRVKREATDDLVDVIQQQQQQGSPLFRATPRAASRSSFGSTSGSSASSTPTHQPMEVARRSPVSQPFTPTERRKVTLVRDLVAQPRSMSPQARPSAVLRGSVVNQNFERKISFSSSSSSHPSPQQWDSVSRCSDRSSSQESMNVEVGRSDSLNALSQSNGRTSAKTPGSCRNKESENVKKGAGVKVPLLPTDDASSNNRLSKSSSRCDLGATSHRGDPELKENDADVPSTSEEPQSPENDVRSSEDYDPPWDLPKRKSGGVLRVNGSVSVPERLSSSGGHSARQLTTSVTHHNKLDEEAKGRPGAKPNGLPSSRPNLNLNLSSDSPRKARQSLTLNFGCAALSAVGEKVDPQLTLEKQGWYHGSISRVDAEGKLRVLKEGSYLVRNSESSKQDYSLSLRSARGFMHMKIVPTSEGRFILGQFSNPFSSIPEMIQHYSVNKLPIKGAEHMSLLYPVMDQLL